MPDPSDLRNYLESNLEDIWRDRQENAEAAAYHGAHKRHADQEILRRAAEQDAQILRAGDVGDITITYSAEYSYDARIVDKEFFALIQRDGLTDEWNQFVKHTYKINKTWINRLNKRGADYRDVIERMLLATQGSPSIDGPSLEQMGGYAPAGKEVSV